MKKKLVLPLIAFGTITLIGCNSRPEPAQLTLISEWGSFNEDYPTPKLTLNVMKSQKFSEVQGIITPKPFFPEVHKFGGWTFDSQGTKAVPDDYVIEGNVTVYANYLYTPMQEDRTYILFNVNYEEQSGEEKDWRHAIKFTYKAEKKATIEWDTTKHPGNRMEPQHLGDGNILERITFSKKSYSIGPCIITIDGKIDDFRLSSVEGGEPFIYGNSFITAVLLADNIKTVGDYAFDSSYWLMATHLPNKLKTIGKYAFNLCYSLNFIEMPPTLETIDNYAFFGCATMEHVYFNSELKRINECAFFGCVSLREIHIPDSVEELGIEAFHYCLLNNDLVIGRGIKKISDRCFGENYYLQKVTIPNNVIELGTACFSHCDSLLEVNFEDGGDPITDYLKVDAPFEYCISLTTVRISSRIQTLGHWSFAHTLLYTLDLSSCPVVVGFGAAPFGHDAPLCYGYGSIIVPGNLVDQYKNTEGWQDYKDIIVAK
ncbi:MAG: leucine-rich repeat protein [Bacilli bacterium]|nr:leucine-rich repeat protein [Bacilli bacterium]